MCVFRTLRADEIECRVGMSKDNGLTLLLYKDARCDMNILDETVGASNWQRKHYECKGNLFCSVGIKENDTWVYKDDCGAESNTEKEKGEASDSFKRACVNWGIGRELYTSPFIWVDASNYRKDDKNKPKDAFSVASINYDNQRRISGLTIKNNNSRSVVYTFGRCKPEAKPSDIISEADRKALSKIAKEQYGDNWKTKIADIFEQHEISDSSKMTFDEFNKIVTYIGENK